ncbi:flagellar export protein FliJ [Brytella acorum]|uniref:Flagellar FliJ protein n=1 Tax=Brytella acorum TaxID=2959299 RepID=A0AA35VAK7_9PROT|nr:flagellar export protein FliJ [Brytella acorum]MDF3623862.1 flagellar export protein FliJ [Brytella acorum]CAI9120778.1 flagellar export protein FliJ [Brytella acorum]
MTRSPLQTLLRLRRQEQEEAERGLAAAIAREREASEAVRHAERYFLEQENFVSSPECDDLAVEAFARWIPRGRAAIQAAQTEEERAGLDRAVAQAAMISARAAFKAVETLDARRQKEARLEAQRREQNENDDLANRPPPF